MRVCVEKYGFLPVDKAAFKGEVPEIKNMVPYEPFDYYIKRKLYVHNMGHTTCAYLGDLLGLEYIYQSIAVPEVRVLVQNAMLESALILNKHYGADLTALQAHITDLLYRFTNAALGDTCQRVGGDSARKLSPADRLIGSCAYISPHFSALWKLLTVIDNSLTNLSILANVFLFLAQRKYHFPFRILNGEYMNNVSNIPSPFIIHISLLSHRGFIFISSFPLKLFPGTSNDCLDDN